MSLYTYCAHYVFLQIYNKVSEPCRIVHFTQIIDFSFLPLKIYIEPRYSLDVFLPKRGFAQFSQKCFLSPACKIVFHYIFTIIPKIQFKQYCIISNTQYGMELQDIYICLKGNQHKWFQVLSQKNCCLGVDILNRELWSMHSMLGIYDVPNSTILLSKSNCYPRYFVHLHTGKLKSRILSQIINRQIENVWCNGLNPSSFMVNANIYYIYVYAANLILTAWLTLQFLWRESRLPALCEKHTKISGQNAQLLTYNCWLYY